MCGSSMPGEVRRGGNDIHVRDDSKAFELEFVNVRSHPHPLQSQKAVVSLRCGDRDRTSFTHLNSGKERIDSRRQSPSLSRLALHDQESR